MINGTLYRREMKNCIKMLLLFAAVITMYIVVIVSMYNPEMLHMLNSLAKTMPQVMAAVGMDASATTLMGFLISYLYGFILLVFPMIFCILKANDLVAKYVESGAMVTLAAAPVKRRTIVFTQMMVLISGISLLTVYVTLMELVSVRIGFPDENIAMELLKVNAGLFCLHLLLGGICFFASCVCSDTKYSIGFGAGIPAFMFVLQMLSNTGEKAAATKYFSVFTLFDPNGLVQGTDQAVFCAGMMLIFAVLLYVLGILIFEKKDLHI